MEDFDRRHIVKTVVIAVGFYWASSLAITRAQDSAKPEIKRSEIKPIIAARVNDIARASKEMLGVEINEQQRKELAAGILADMESRGTYEFVDP
jgi:hypothetical protein